MGWDVERDIYPLHSGIDVWKYGSIFSCTAINGYVRPLGEESNMGGAQLSNTLVNIDYSTDAKLIVQLYHSQGTRRDNLDAFACHGWARSTMISVSI